MKKPILLIGLLILGIVKWAQISASSNTEHEIFSAEAVEKITIDAGFGWGIFGGSVYNGNSDYTITQITVKLTPSQIIGTSRTSPLVAERYHIDITVPPLTKAALSMPLDVVGTPVLRWTEMEGTRARGHEATKNQVLAPNCSSVPSCPRALVPSHIRVVTIDSCTLSSSAGRSAR